MSEVRLIGITQPQIPECENAAELVAYAARVSNPSNQSNKVTAPRLLKYLMNHKHWSPFEMVTMVMEIKTTRDIGRQILRHRSFSYQEFSQRYAEVSEWQTREARLQDDKNRQNSVEIKENSNLCNDWEALQVAVLNKAEEVYSWALDKGIAKEQARAVLPEGMTKTSMYMSGTLRSWIHYCQLRCGPETQKEHRIVANQCWKIVLDNFPALKGLI